MQPCVLKSRESLDSAKVNDIEDGAQSLVIRNIPYQYTAAQLEDDLAELGLENHYSRLYLFLNRKQTLNLGYALVTLKSTDRFESFKQRLQRYKFNKHGSRFCKGATVTLSHSCIIPDELKR